MQSLENLFDLKKKIIVITGGYGYLGSVISKGLAEIGARVVVIGQDPIKGERFVKTLSQKEEIYFYGCDLKNEQRVDETFNKIYSEIGIIDVLINNANYGKGGKIEDISGEDWQSGIDGTINNYFRCIQKSLNYIRKPGGKIINISSMYGLVSPDPSIYGNSGFNNPPNYGVGKAGIIQLTKYAAVNLAEYGINVNCISPGPFPSTEVQQNKKFISSLIQKVPLKRIGKPDELLGAVILLSSSSSSYINGHNLIVDGGWTIW
ncbi:MAG: SDR family oxidoreductase [Ignavibacterium sp.]